MIFQDDNSLLGAHDWSLPVPISFGPGRLSELGVHCKRLGIRRPLIITDRGSANLSFIEKAESILLKNDLAADVFSDIAPNPRDLDIAAARSSFRKGDHDGIIAMGGGSGLDGAKATCLVARNELDIWKFDFDQDSPIVEPDSAFPPLICIPTTAGTGAETESTAMITHTGRGMKLCVWHPQVKPSVVLLDPEVTLALPPNLTSWTGLDALVHAVEAYCVPDLHPICDGVALQALTMIRRWLPHAVNDPGNLTARGGMQIGACLAGISFLKGLGLVHSISHMVGAEYDTHHGLTNSILLPAVLRFNKSAIAHKIPGMLWALGIDGDGFDAFYTEICALLDQLGIPKTLAEIGIEGDTVETLTAKAMQDAATSTNPRKPSELELKEVILDAISFGR